MDHIIARTARALSILSAGSITLRSHAAAVNAGKQADASDRLRKNAGMAHKTVKKNTAGKSSKGDAILSRRLKDYEQMMSHPKAPSALAYHKPGSVQAH